MCRCSSTDFLIFLLLITAFPAAFSALSAAMLWLAVPLVALVLFCWLAGTIGSALDKRRYRKEMAHRAKLWRIIEEDNSEEPYKSLYPWL
jgi:hypothetical protein